MIRYIIVISYYPKFITAERMAEYAKILGFDVSWINPRSPDMRLVPREEDTIEDINKHVEFFQEQLYIRSVFIDDYGHLDFEYKH